MNETQKSNFYKKICEKIDNVYNVGDEFLLEDLVEPKLWGELTKGDRTSLGRYLSQKVKDREIDNIKIVSPQGRKNKYRKIK